MTGDQRRPQASSVEVVEYTDPMCPWAWGSEPVFRKVRAASAGRVRWRRVYAILFDHDDDPPPDPAAETAWYARYVEEISAHSRAPRASRLSRVPAGSWPSSLVARAADRQGEEVAERVLRRLRESVFVLGEPADTVEAALSVVRGVPGLDPRRLAADAALGAVLEQVRADRAEARRPVAEVLPARSSRRGGRNPPSGSPHSGTARETPEGGYRYALPTLLLRGAEEYRVVPGWRPFEEYAAAFDELGPGLLAVPPPLSPADALERYRSLTEPERLLLTEGRWPPASAVRVDTGNGSLWLHSEEAAVHPAVR